MKKAMGSLAVILCLITNTHIFAAGTFNAIDDISVQSDTGIITLKGYNLSHRYDVISLEVLKAGASWSDLSSFNPHEGDLTQILSYFDSVSGIEYGEPYTFTFVSEFNNVIPAFRIRFGADGFAYHDPSLIENINAAKSADELKDLVISNENLWGEIHEIYEKNIITSTEEAVFWQKMLLSKNAADAAGSPIMLLSDVVNLVAPLIEMTKLYCADTMDNMFLFLDRCKENGRISGNSYELLNQQGEFAEYPLYDKQKENLARYLIDNRTNYSDISSFLDDFNEYTVLHAVNGGSKAMIAMLLEKSDEIDRTQLKKYMGLSDAEKLEVSSKLGEASVFKSISALIHAAEELAGGMMVSNKKPVSNGGGGFHTNIAISKSDGANNNGSTTDESVLSHFDDIENVEWAQEAIYALAGKGVLVGNGDRRFYPDRNVSREEFVKMLVVSFGLQDNTAGLNFDDITKEDWSYPYIATAVKYKLVNGIDADTFGKGRPITREEMATMLHRAVITLDMQLAENAYEGFVDFEEISKWARESCTYLQKTGVLLGTGDGKFVPKMCVTRAQAAKAIYELLKKQGGLQ